MWDGDSYKLPLGGGEKIGLFFAYICGTRFYSCTNSFSNFTMSTFHLTVPDSLAERMTDEEIRCFLEEQLRRLEIQSEDFISLNTLRMLDASVHNFHNGNVGSPINLDALATLLHDISDEE
ncbi:MAG: hypothetical protein EAZ92_02965 [Candidatus Kapaibacterium sp.]|nr:MAG: hypothetical protein EAZ92_02965 [Candidatus Kapabacteria bacterium]